MLEQQLRRVWEQLRSKQPTVRNFLQEVRIDGLRGMDGLVARFTYPVSVIAGPNGCGKSTLLSALACAYTVPGTKLKEYVPSSLFPDFSPKNETVARDNRSNVRLSFGYIYEGQRIDMIWERQKYSWNRGFLGRKHGKQPVRDLYRRTLFDLSHPYELRSVQQITKFLLEKEEVDAGLLLFAHRILPFTYLKIYRLWRKDKDYLFAERQHGEGDGGGLFKENPSYSEFHMSAGERAILRLSRDLSNRKNALVLIDEIEAGLHPYTQQQLMLEFQRLALKNDLQIVVTTHSSAVLECVPQEARIFMERDSNGVSVRPPYKDVIEKALYGQSFSKLSILCEDHIAESMIRGMLDEINIQENVVPSDIIVGRDTGKDEFPNHVRAIAKFSELENFVFILDGDGQHAKAKAEAAASRLGKSARIMLLPGEAGPEQWLWKQLRGRSDFYAKKLGMDCVEFSKMLVAINSVYDGASSSEAEKFKGKIETLCERLSRDSGEIARLVAREEVIRGERDIHQLNSDLIDAIRLWRNQASA